MLKDSSLSVIGNVVGKGFSLLAGIFVAQLLGKDIFGQFSFIKNTILTIGILSSFGLGYTATKYIAEERAINEKRIPLIISTVFIMNLILSFLVSSLLYYFSMNQSKLCVGSGIKLVSEMPIIVLITALNSFGITQIGILAGFGNFRHITLLNIVVGCLNFICSLALTYSHGFEGALIAMITVEIAQCLIGFYLISKLVTKWKIKMQFDKAFFLEMLSFSIPIGLRDVLYAFTSWYTYILLLSRSNYGELGLYAAAIQWNAMILFIPGILRNVILSHLARNNNDLAAQKKIIQQIVNFYFFATVIPCLIIFCFSNLIENWYGLSYVGLGNILSLILLGTVFQAVNNVYSQAFMAMGRNWLIFFINLLKDFLILFTFVKVVQLTSITAVRALILTNLVFTFVGTVSIIVVFNISFNKKMRQVVKSY